MNRFFGRCYTKPSMFRRDSRYREQSSPTLNWPVMWLTGRQQIWASLSSMKQFSKPSRFGFGCSMMRVQATGMHDYSYVDRLLPDYKSGTWYGLLNELRKQKHY